MIQITDTNYGIIKISGRTYTHDIYVLPNGDIEIRDKSHSHRIKGHRDLSKWELEKLIETNPDFIIIGSGQYGELPMDKSTESWLEFQKLEKKFRILKDRTPIILERANELFERNKRVAAIFHITC